MPPSTNLASTGPQTLDAELEKLVGGRIHGKASLTKRHDAGHVVAKSTGSKIAR